MIDVLTTCPFCGCGCGLYLQVERGIVTGITPSQKHPISRGRLCARGWHAYEFIQHPDRLTRPLIRRKGDKKKTTGNGKGLPRSLFREADWNEALNIVVSRLNTIKSDYGSDSLGVIASAKCTNEDNYTLMKLTRAVLKTNNLDNGGRLYDAATFPALRVALGIGASTNSINELENAEVICLLGADPTNVHPQVSARIINAVSRGAKLILIDSRKTHLSKFSHMCLQLKPGSYVGFINGLIYILIHDNIINIKSTSKYTANFSNLRKMVAQYDPKRVEDLTGIPGKKIRQVAKYFHEGKKAMFVYSTGLTQQAAGIDNIKALSNLVVLSRNLGAPSTGILSLLEQNNQQGAIDIGCLPDFLPGHMSVQDDRCRKKVEKLWGVKIPKEAGLTVLDMLIPGNLRGMYIVGENPIVTAPDVESVQKTLEQLDFLVVQDIFLTETAEYADVILPAACYAEKEGTFTNLERRVQKIRKAVDPPGKSKPDWWIIKELAVRMGFPMNVSSPGAIFNEIADLNAFYGGINYGRFDTTWGIQWPCPDVNHAGTPFLHGEYFHRSNIYFSPVEQDGYTKPHFTPVRDIPLIEPTDVTYPFTLTTGSLYYQWHSGTMTRRSATLNREYPEVFAALHRKDAESLNIRNGERIRVISRRGEMETAALLTDMVQEKTIFIPFHYKETAARVLINPSLLKKTKVPDHLCAVRIEKL
ncbi:formate dehydrogenase subunit alpha [bacterium]